MTDGVNDRPFKKRSVDPRLPSKIYSGTVVDYYSKEAKKGKLSNSLYNQYFDYLSIVVMI